MKNLESTALRYIDKELLVLDQRTLPKEEYWHNNQTTEQLIELIQGLAIRGAPLIGISASLWIGHCADRGDSKTDLEKTIALLRAARPTAVNLMNNLDHLLNTLNNTGDTKTLADEAVKLFEEDVRLCESMAEHGNRLINESDNVLTHCNTGGLATVGIGTALGVIQYANKAGKNIHVWVDETRPLLQGARLTAWELRKAGINHTLISDNMAASLMAEGKVDKIFVGSDRIATNGDFANKIGTYSLAVLAQYHNVPFYVVAPYTTVDFNCDNGGMIPIEQRNADEVRGVSGSFGQCTWAPENTPVHNPAFDVTPAHLVTGWVLDRGIFNIEDIRQDALKS